MSATGSVPARNVLANRDRSVRQQIPRQPSEIEAEPKSRSNVSRLITAGVAFAMSTLLWMACDPSQDVSHGGFVWRRIEVSPVARIEFTLAPHSSSVFEARNRSGGVRPILHLWDMVERQEVARASSSWWQGATSLTYRNPHEDARRYTLLARASGRGDHGHVNLWRDGRMVQRHVALGGSALKVATGRGFTYRAAAVPGGTTAPWLLGLDGHGALQAIAAPEGDLEMPRLASSHAIERVVVATVDDHARRGELSLYANDPDDHDGDGLGRALERALGTCDGPNEPGCAASPLSDYYKQVRQGTRDTDRDGISDADEVFGVTESRLLDLPRFGADPRHKDVFIEVDYQAKLNANFLSEEDLQGIQRWFAHGAASALRNPDLKPGIRLHVDVGFAPRDRRDAGLFGDWGGASAVTSGTYTSASRTDKSSVRRGYFRYALAAGSGTGQTRGDAFTFSVYQHRKRYFAHELGHTLGLVHHGEDSFGVANCKPNYQSIMNYAYQNSEQLGFATHPTPHINPARMREVGGLRGLQAKMLSEPPFELDVVGHDVDWNRDGKIEDAPVRAGVTWATYKSCGVANRGRQTLWQGAAHDASPAIVRTGHELHVLWVDAEGAVLWSHGSVSGPDRKGSCPLGDADGSNCMEWSPPHEVTDLSNVRHISTTTLDDDHFVLASTDADGQVRVQVMGAAGAWDSLASGAQHVLADARSESAPTVAWLRVDRRYYGTDRLLGVWWRRDPDGRLMQALALLPEGPWVLRTAIDTRGDAIDLGVAPSVAALGTLESCGVFPDAESSIRFYCYLPERDAWTDLTRQAFYAGLGPSTLGQVGIAYHRFRYANGDAIDAREARGAVILSFTERNSHNEPDNPKYLISQWLSTTRTAQNGIDFRWRGAVIDQWTNLAPHTGVALYEDERLSSLKAAMTTRPAKGGDTKLEVLPLADGAYDADLGSGNDFEVMERGVCRGIRPEAWCGDRRTAAY